MAVFWLATLLMLYRSFPKSYKWLKHAFKKGIDEIEKHYLDLMGYERSLPTKSLALFLAEICVNLVRMGRKLKDPEVEEVKRFCNKE